MTDASVCADCSVECADAGEGLAGGDGCVDCAECFTEAPTAQRELNLRPYVVGLLRSEGRSLSVMMFVLLLLSTVSFDGFSATPVWGRMFNALFDVTRDAHIVGSIGLFGFFAAVVAVYIMFSGFMSMASGYRLLPVETGQVFVLTLDPDCAGLPPGALLLVPADPGAEHHPAGVGPVWVRVGHLLGTVGYEINIGIIGARTVWLVSVAAIVVGHVAAVYLAHVTALRAIPERRYALRSQYPMLVLMVAYTMVSLWILAQPIVEPSAG